MVTASIKKDLQIMTDLTKASGRQNHRELLNITNTCTPMVSI